MPRGAHPELRVQLAVDTSSVPGARRFVIDGLRQWGREHLVDDAALCVTEMAANSAMHSGSPYLRVRLLDIKPGVRVTVEDARGMVPFAAVTPPPVASQGTTGRDLPIVSVLAKSWRIEDRGASR